MLDFPSYTTSPNKDDGPSGCQDTASSVPSFDPSTSPTSSTAPMIDHVDRLEAVASTFNHSVGNQQNHTINIASAVSVLCRQMGGSSASSSTLPHPSPPPFRPTRLRRTSDISHAQAVVRMFGNINHFYSSRLSQGEIAQALFIPAHLFTTIHSVPKSPCGLLLSQAADQVQSIRQGVQSSRYRERGFIRLAEHGCTLVTALMIVRQHRQREWSDLSPELVASLRQLVKKLRPIVVFLHARRGVRARVKQVLYKSETAQVAEYRDKLLQALAEFGSTNIAVPDGAAQVDMLLEDLVSAIEKIGSQAGSSSDSTSPPLDSSPSSLVPVTSSASEASPTSGSAGATGSVSSDVKGDQMNYTQTQNISMTGGNIVFGSLSPADLTPYYPMVNPTHTPMQNTSPIPARRFHFEQASPDRADTHPRQLQSRQAPSETILIPGTSSRHTQTVEFLLNDTSDSPIQSPTDLPDTSDATTKNRHQRRQRSRNKTAFGEKVCRFYLTPEGCRNGDACKFRHASLESPGSISSHSPLDD